MVGIKGERTPAENICCDCRRLKFGHYFVSLLCNEIDDHPFISA
tara:strand:+ start:104 stop:235 length:132 start_codon:yes stop_codon:yes gene_type:complete